jgi:hypothetical protein
MSWPILLVVIAISYGLGRFFENKRMQRKLDEANTSSALFIRDAADRAISEDNRMYAGDSGYSRSSVNLQR